MYNWITLLCPWNIIRQIYVNKIYVNKKTGEAKESPEHTHIPCNQFFIPPEGSIYIGTLVTSINNN